MASHLEDALKVFESILENDDIAALYPASRNVLATLTELHATDSSLLSPESRARVEAQANQEKKKRSGRDSFNTGF